jgi:hypothetical protein
MKRPNNDAENMTAAKRKSRCRYEKEFKDLQKQEKELQSQKTRSKHQR